MKKKNGYSIIRVSSVFKCFKSLSSVSKASTVDYDAKKQ